MKKTILCVIGFAVTTLFFGTACNNNGVQSDDGEVDAFLNGFIDNTLTVDVYPEDGGSVSRSLEQAKYPSGTEVTLTAKAALGYVFTGWSGASKSTDNAITLSVAGHKKLTANFKESAVEISGAAAWEKTMDIISRNGDNKEYTVDLSSDIVVSGGAAFGSAKGITVTLEGSATVTLSGNGSILKIGEGQTVILKDATLKGHDGNNAPLVYVDGGTFEMEGGTISGNTNNASDGGGVYVGGGTFNMSGGRIFENTAHSGGGVYVSGGTFTMTGRADGESAIWGNTANYYYDGNSYGRGGGVYVGENAAFAKTGGVINGYDGDPTNGNVVKSNDRVSNGSGHAVWAGYGNDNKRKETSAVLNMDLYYNGVTGDFSGDWDY